MPELLGSVVLAVIGITGLYLAGRPRFALVGWSIGLDAQVLWALYAVATGQYGFLLSCAAYGWVYYLNLRRALDAEIDAGLRRRGAEVLR